MAVTVEQLVIDPQSRFLEMKSVQPYSTTDEYLYAMKEDLADWLSNLYPDWYQITVGNFLESLENGVLLCKHANNVNDAARKTSPSFSSLTNCKYRSDARPQTFNARDNVSQFIKWARNIAGVREVLMFESDDLILRKNEKNFVLCLLEIARFGAKFGISVPAIIKLENEIEREIENDKQTFNQLNPFENHDDLYFNLNKQNLSNVQIYSNENREKQFSDESYDSIISNDIDTTIRTSNDEKNQSNQPPPPPSSSSYLHKTVVKITNNCCCSQRFPVIRIGEGKYRIGESGTIIFIRILRNHVMVRVGGGWDTLENYLNKHDPCRRSKAHRGSVHHDHHSDIPILAVPNPNISPSVQKNTPFGKSIRIKTEEFPLAKPSNSDTNLVDAQLVITRDNDGRHRIGTITYKSEEDVANQPTQCPQHHNHNHNQDDTFSRLKVKPTRFTSSIDFKKQSSPSTDQDYSSLTETSPSKSSSIDLKEVETLDLTQINQPSNIKSKNYEITESIIDTIDGFISNKLDFDSQDIKDVMKSNPDEDTTNIDNDSLESGDDLLEEKKTNLPMTPKKSTGYCSSFYLAEKQKFQKQLVANRKRSISSFGRCSSRSNNLLNVVDMTKKDEQINKTQCRKPTFISKRSQSSELVDISKLDRDSGFDEQDFHRERLHSNGDDNSSVSSIRSSIQFEYKENKAYDLRMKKLETKRNSTLNTGRSSNLSIRRASETRLPTPPINKTRKNSQQIVNVKQQQKSSTNSNVAL